MNEHLIIATTNDGMWLTGRIDDYPFGIRVADEDLFSGIDGGRIMKLYVKSKDGSEDLLRYEHSWKSEPNTVELTNILGALVLFASALPEQEDWAQSFRKQLRFLVTEDIVTELATDCKAWDLHRMKMCVKSHTLAVMTNDGKWLTGTIDGFPFGIMVRDESAPTFGINGGRVIRLYVRSSDYASDWCSYEAYWRKQPETPEVESILNALLTFAASLPSQEVWRETLRWPHTFFLNENGLREVK